MRSDACFIVFQFHPVSMCVSASLRGGIAHERLGNWDSKHGSWFCFIFFDAATKAGLFKPVKAT